MNLGIITCLVIDWRIKKEKILEYKMPNNQIPNYGVQTQYVSIRSTT